MKEVAYIFVGWLLGLLAPAITERIKLIYYRNRVRSGIVTEINHLEHTAASSFLMIEIHRGRFNKELLLWYMAYADTKDLPPPFDKMSEILPKLTSLDDSLFAEATRQFTIPSDRGMHLKKFSLPYSTSKLGDLELFKEDASRMVLSLLSRVDIINQQIEDTKFYYGLTFDSSLSKENHTSASNQLVSIYDSVSAQVRLLVDSCKLTKSKMQR